MLIQIEPSLLGEVTGGSVRLAGPRTSAMIAMMISQITSMVSSMQAGGNDILTKFLPMMIAFKKGDTDGMFAAAAGGKPDGGDKDKGGDKASKEA